MFPPRLLKSINGAVALAMLLQPILAAVPTPVAHAAPAAEVEPQAAPAAAPPAAELLTATVPAPLLGANPSKAPDKPLAAPSLDEVEEQAGADQERLLQNPAWQPASADFTVNSPADGADPAPGNGICATAGGACTLRAAIEEANALLGEQTIAVPAQAEHYALDSDVGADLLITDNLTIVGEGATTTVLDGYTAAWPHYLSVFQVDSPNVSFRISGMTIQLGDYGIRAKDSLVMGDSRVITIADCIISRNGAGFVGGDGYGDVLISNSIVSQNGTGIAPSAESVIVDHTTISQNEEDGISSGAFDTTVNDSIISDNGEAGIFSYDSGTISRSIVSGNGYGIGAGSLTMDKCIITGNKGVGVIGGESITDSLITNNSGGGAYFWGPPFTSVTNSTISGNVGDDFGGVWLYSNDTVCASVSFLNTTIANNRARSGAAGGIALYGACYLGLENTIIADNAGQNCNFPTRWGSYTPSLGHNLSNDETCHLTDPTDLPNTDPLLGQLRDNGGPTFTHALQPGSPAIDAGSDQCYDHYHDPIPCPSTDQRGVARPQGAGIDIGAYEAKTEIPLADHLTGGGSDWPVDNLARQTRATVGNPIDTASGNQTFEAADLRLPTASGDITFSRSYSSFNAYYNSLEPAAGDADYYLPAGSLGPGWMHNYETRLLMYPPNPDISLLGPGGSRMVFAPDSANPNHYKAQSAGGDLEQRNDGHLVYTSPEGIQMFFYDFVDDTADGTDQYLMGRLHQIDFGLDGVIDLQYAPQTYLLQTVTTAGSTGPGTHSMSFVYHTYYPAAGGSPALIRLQRVELSDGRSISFDYASVTQGTGPATPEYRNTNLSTFTDVRGQTWSYIYADSTTHPDPALDYVVFPYLRHFLVERRMPAPDGQAAIIRYRYQMSTKFDVGLADAQTFRELDGAGQPAVTVEYDTGTGPTASHFGAGPDANQRYAGPTVKHTYDAAGRLTQEWILGLATGWKTQYAVDPNDPQKVLYNSTSTTDPNGHSTTYTWAADNVSQETVTDAASSQFYQFVSQRLGLHLPELIFYPYPEADKGPTRIHTRLIYNTPKVVNPNQPFAEDMLEADEDERIPNPYLDELNPDHGPDEAPYPDLPQQQLLGRIDNPDAAGNGYTTRYYYYDGGLEKGRVKCVHVPTPNGDTFYEYDDVSGQPTHVYQGCTCNGGDNHTGGLHTQITYDSLKRVLDTNGPDATVTHYEYVGRSDLVKVVTRNYDAARLTLEEDATTSDTWNIKTAYFYDAAGRVTATIENYHPTYDHGEPYSVDLDGDTIAESFRIDPNAPHINRITRYTYDAAGRVEQVTANFHPGRGDYEYGYNFKTRTVYDGAGRVAAAIENYTAGALTVDGAIIPAVNRDLDGDGSAETPLALSASKPDRNRVTLNRYNAQGRLEQVISPAWPPASGEVFDDYHEVDGVIYNRVTAYEYDPAGNVTRTTVNYDPASGVSVTDRNVATCTVYDVLNRPVFTRTNCLPGQSDYYPLNGSVYNRITYTAYDALSRPIVQVENYDGQTTLPMPETIDLTLTPERNHVTRIYYDGLGRAEWVVRNMTGSTGQTIDDILIRAAAGDPDRNLVTRTYYNEAGQQIAVVENYGEKFGSVGQIDQDLKQEEITAGLEQGYNHVTRTFYRADGLVDTVVSNFVGDILGAQTPPAFVSGSPDRNLTTRYDIYDTLHRPRATTLLRGGEDLTNAQIYDNLGRVTSSTFDVLGEQRVTKTAYAGLGFSVTTTDPAAKIVQTTADVRGNPSTKVAPGTLDLAAINIYDLLGRVTYSYDGANAPVLTTYDALGQVLKTTRGDQVTTYSYNLLGQVVLAKTTGTTEAGDACSATYYQYNNSGSLLRVVENYTNTGGCGVDEVELPRDAETEYSYDEMGRLASIELAHDSTIPTGSTRKYEYDALGQTIFEVLDPDGQKLFTQYCYDAAGNVKRTIRGSGQASADAADCAVDPAASPHLVTQYTYDALGHPTSIDYEEAGGGLEAAADVTFTYDVFGSRATMTETGGRVWTYTSTPDGLLQTVDWAQGAVQGAQVSYEYDASGSRTRLAVDGLMDIGYQPDAAGRLEFVDVGNDDSNDVTYAYNKASHVTQVSLPNGITSAYTYDLLGQLSTITHGSLSSFGYILDGLGNRTTANEVLYNPGSQGAMAPAFGWGSPSEQESPNGDLVPVPESSMPTIIEVAPAEPDLPEAPAPTPELPNNDSSQATGDQLSVNSDQSNSNSNSEQLSAVSNQQSAIDNRPIDQSPNHPITQSHNQSINQSTNRPINQLSGPPAAPSHLVVTTDGPTGLTITWQDNSDNETGFVLEGSADGGATWTQLADQAATTFVHTPLLCQTTHNYRVRATNGDGASEWATGGGATGSCWPGMLDATFGVSGIVTTSSQALMYVYASAAVIQPDGKIVVAGNGNDTFALARYNPDGSLDTSFSGDGITTIARPASAEAYAVALQPDGKIVVAGSGVVGNYNNFMLARLTASGALDTSFGSAGVVTTDLGGYDIPYSVAVQPDGKIIAAGMSGGGGAALVRYNADGSLDTTFGAGGIVITALEGSVGITDIALQPDGKIIAAWWGCSLDWSTCTSGLYRYLPDGSLDASFGSGGVAQPTDGEGFAEVVALQPDGKIIAAGSSQVGSINEFALERCNADGSLDTTFGTSGQAISNFGLDTDVVAVILQQDGAIVLVGQIYDGPYSNGTFALVRYTAAGVLDTSFSDDGLVTTTPVAGVSEVYAMDAALQPDGRIVVVGNVSPNTDNAAIVLARYHTAEPPAAPTDLTATPAGPDQINLAWTDNSGDETAFRIERSPDGVSGWVEAGQVAANVTTYQDPERPCGAFYYRVRAYRAGDESTSEYSNVASASVGICAPAAPTDLTATAAGQSQIDLAWTDNSADETAFHVERSSSGTSGWAEIGMTTADATAFSDSGLTCGTTYHYRVRAYRAGDDVYSVYSSATSTSTAACQGVLVITGGPLAFGNRDVTTTSAPQTLTLSNTGTGPVAIDSITASGEFVLAASGSCPPGASTLAAGAGCTVDVVFAPLSAGAKSGQVTVTGAEIGTQTIDLSGTGVTPPTPAQTTLAGPAAGALTNDNTPEFTWNATTGGYRYQLQVDNNSDFSSPAINDATIIGLSYTPVTPLAGAVYYWRVRAYNSVNVAGAWSATPVRTLTIDTTPPAAPALSAPANDLDVQGTPTYTWLASSTATLYRLEIDTRADFSTEGRYAVEVTTLNHAPPTQDPNLYFWRVQARDAAGNWGAWSVTRRVTVVPANGVAPALVNPAASALLNDNTPDLSWSATAYGVAYQVQVDNNTDFSSPEISADTGADVFYTPADALADGVYSWRVRSRDIFDVWSTWSTRTFTVDTTPPAAPVLNTPADGASTTDTTPALALVAVTGASRYIFQVADNPDFTGALEGAVTTTSFTPSAAQALTYGTVYSWRAQACDAANNCGDWSAVRRLTVTVHSAPANGAQTTDTTPAFTWAAVTGATNYQLQADNNEDFSSPEIDRTQTAYTYTPPALAYGRYTWHVRVQTASGWGEWMPAWTVIVTTTLLAAPTPANPPTGTVTNDNTPAVFWNAVANAAAYQVQMDNNGATFPSPEVDATTTDQSYSPTEPLADGTYTWRLRTQNIYGAWGAWSAWSPARTVIVDTTPPAVPALNTPVDGASTTDTTPALALVAVTGASRYIFQVADNPDFTGALEGAVTTTSFTPSAAQALTYGTVYFWRAQACDAANNCGDWSAVRRLTVTVHSAPANGAQTTDTTPAFTWQSVTGATNYQLQADNNEDFSSPEIDRTQTAYTYTPPALAYGRYTWHVRVQTASGWGEWMPAWTVIVTTTLLAAPTPANPPTGTVTNDNTPAVFWNAVANAAAYQVQMDNNGAAFPSPEVDAAVPAEAGITYLPTEPLADGTYTWRLRTQNVYGAWGAWSAWSPARTVIVDTTPPAPPALTAPTSYATVFGTPTYTWAASTTAAAYQFQVDDDAGFIDPLYTSTEQTARTLKPPTQQPGEYFWRVRARDAAGNWSAWSAAWVVDVAPGTPSQPVLVSPASGATTAANIPDFTWNAADYGERYQIQIDNVSTFASPEQDAIVGMRIYTAERLPNATYYWRVRAINALGQRGAWSGYFTLIVNANPPPIPELVGPVDGSQHNDPAPRFTWTAVAGGEYYQLQIIGEAGPVQTVSLPADATSYVVDALASGSYTWRVRSVSAAGATLGWTAASSLTIDTGKMQYNWHYEYDGLSRLTYACANGWHEDTRKCDNEAFSYTYDQAGNLTGFTRFDAVHTRLDTLSFTIDPATNQVDCAATNGGACIDYVYDAYGNLTSDGSSTYTYDTANRLVKVQRGTDVTQYEYSGDGDRVAETVGGVRTEFTLDVASSLTNVLAETTNGQTISYIYGLGLVGEMKTSVGMAEYYLTDALGSVRQLTDPGGRVLLSQSFDPFGNPFERFRGGVLWDTQSPFGWTGEQSDPNGLTYLRARYYAPSMGRFTQIDPSGAEANGYQYAGSSPTMYGDPSGLSFAPGNPCALDPLGCLIAGITGTKRKSFDEMTPLEKMSHNASLLPGPSVVFSPAIPLATEGVSQFAGLVGRALGQAAAWEASAGEAYWDISGGILRGLEYAGPKLAFAFEASMAAAVLRDALGIQAMTPEEKEGYAFWYLTGLQTAIWSVPASRSASAEEMESTQWLLINQPNYRLSIVSKGFSEGGELPPGANFEINPFDDVINSNGRILLTGEGNFTFARALVDEFGVNPARIVATDLVEMHEGVANAQYLAGKGVTIRYGVNMKSLPSDLGKFDFVISNFPYAYGSRRIFVPNHTSLFNGFFESAPARLAPGGRIMVSYKTSWPYSMVDITDIAASKGLWSLSYPFPENTFWNAGYRHQMNHAVGSANIEGACVYVFGVCLP